MSIKLSLNKVSSIHVLFNYFIFLIITKIYRVLACFQTRLEINYIATSYKIFLKRIGIVSGKHQESESYWNLGKTKRVRDLGIVLMERTINFT